MSDILRIKSISLFNINCFDHISIEFNDKYNLICGTNGIGKTSILDSIGGTASPYSASGRVRRNALAKNNGKVILEVSNDGNSRIISGEIASFDPDSQTLAYGQPGLSPNIIYITTNRDFYYTKLMNISRDPERNEFELSQIAGSGIMHHETKGWFANRYLFQHHSSDANHQKNFELAKECFSLLDNSVKLYTVEPSSFNIIVSTSHGKIPYEYLSSGFRASLSLLLSIIREIEFRKLGVAAKEFSGVILIDELDLHLHPTWQKVLPRALRESFPAAQIIVTSHSPHMVQDANANEVIVLRANDEGRPRHASLKIGKYGFQGWTVEEILEDVMGLKDVETPLFKNLMKKFDDAVDSEQAEQVIKLKDELEAILHPANPLHKLIRLQAAPFAGGAE